LSVFLELDAPGQNQGINIASTNVMHHIKSIAIWGAILFYFPIISLFSRELRIIKKEILIKEIISNYDPPSTDIGDPEKYYWPKTLARLEMYGANDSLANNWISMFAERSPFHFTLVGMARIMHLYPNAPAIVKQRNTILKKVFERTDSYNCWTAEGTENHINMSRTSGYLFAQEAIKHNYKTDEARIHHEEMKEWILNWSKLIYQKGTGEWNSGIYGTYNLIGWLNLYDFSEDAEVKSAAKTVCDYYATEMALYYSWGVLGGAEMRGTGVGKNLGTSTSYQTWFWFSDNEKPDFSLGREYIQAIHAATSTYQPAEVIIQLAKKNMEKPFHTFIQMPDYLLTKLGFCQNQLYASNHFTLGSMASAYGGWSGSTSQIVSWKMVAKPEKPEDVPFQMSGNGLYYDNQDGKIRDPFTQIIQKENVLFQLTFVPKNVKEIEAQINALIKKWSLNWKNDFFLRFPEEGYKKNVVKGIKEKTKKTGSYLSIDNRTSGYIEDGITFLEMNGTYAAIRSISQLYPVEDKSDYDKKTKFQFMVDRSKNGQLSGFVIEMGDFGSHGSFQKFKAAIKKTNIIKPSIENPYTLVYNTSKGERLEAKFQPEGSFEEAIVDWGYGVQNQQTHINSAPFVQPAWPSGAGMGKVGVLVEHPYPVSNSIFSGPVVNLENGLLRIQMNGKQFEVRN
jgi:hypothetical protein